MRWSEVLFYLFLIVAVSVVVVIFVDIITPDDTSQKFDEEVKKGTVVIDGEIIQLGSRGSPKRIDGLPPNIPNVKNSISLFPRLTEITKDCQFYTLDPNMRALYVATTSSEPDLIHVYMPPTINGAVNICKQVSYNVKVILWGQSAEQNFK